ncbi:MAG: hypothetical protein QNJ31_06580 [Candidatus Caenarcaniphilales bacterium]|nr:hypothetical protein [Candidatus Caenarcaniphilales bacterium]
MVFVLGLITTGCTLDKVKNDCKQFDKGFLQACNENCPSKCTEVASASKEVTLSKKKISSMCKETCAKHCLLQLEKVRPNQCRGKNK